MQKWEVLLVALIPVGVLLIFLPFVWSTHLDQVVVTVGAFFAITPWGYVFALSHRYLLRRLHFEPSGPASDDELLREDEVLMEATAFLQGIIFIYLNLVPSATGSFVTSLKWSVPTFGVLFYICRAYARIKQSGRFRYYSIWIFLYMIFFDISAFTYSYSPHFYIAGVDIMYTLLSATAVLIYAFLRYTLTEQAKARYGMGKTTKQTQIGESQQHNA